MARPFYRISIAVLGLAALAGAVALLLLPGPAPGFQIESGVPFQTSGTPGETSAAQALIDINAASAVALESLPGIGPVLAQRIVDYWGDNGPFERTDQLMAVDGIGPATFERLHMLVTAGS